MSKKRRGSKKRGSKKPVTLLGNMDPEFQSSMGLMMAQVTMLMIVDAGGVVDIPVSRVDEETKGLRMDMEIVETEDNGKVFRFKIAGMKKKEAE